MSRALWHRQISPSRTRLILVSILLLGGIGNVWGAIVATAFVVIVPEKLQTIQEYRFLLYAVMVVLVLRFQPEGLLPRPVRRYFLAMTDQAPAPLLQVEGLTKTFGGVLALDALSLSVGSGEVVGLIGPNGSGKTTFFNVTTGIYRPNAGQHRFPGQEPRRRLAADHSPGRNFADLPALPPIAPAIHFRQHHDRRAHAPLPTDCSSTLSAATFSSASWSECSRLPARC